MNFLEKDLEEIIFFSDKKLLEQRGLRISGKLKRQKMIGKYGIPDLIEMQRPYYHHAYRGIVKGDIIVYELKKEKVSVSSFLQALGYLKGIKRYLEKRKKAHLFNFSIVVIGKKMDLNSSFCYLPEFINHNNDGDLSLDENPKFSFRAYTYHYDIDGFLFEEQEGFSATKEGF